jgi:hypothetical protein
LIIEQGVYSFVTGHPVLSELHALFPFRVYNPSRTELSARAA